MALVTDTATANPPAPPRLVEPEPAAVAPARDPRPVGEARARARRRLSPLTRRIVAVNLLPLALLAVGFLYLGKFEQSLIGQQIESLKTQGEIFSAALGEGAVLDSADEGQILVPALSRDMMRRLAEPTRTRARLFALNGKPIADSRLLRGAGDAVQVTELPPLTNEGAIGRFFDRVYDWVGELLARGRHYPVYHESEDGTAEHYPEVMRALHGETGSFVRSDPSNGGLVIGVAVPVQRYKEVLGALLLSTSNGEIEDELRLV
ncbi:MAG TPA: stimulus-sensing domain-containing protein, partial [Stellaceae bacterium]|nr:stimulus-sensing domain-containing protein [Stellaceae bacterium]